MRSPVSVGDHLRQIFEMTVRKASIANLEQVENNNY